MAQAGFTVHHAFIHQAAICLGKMQPFGPQQLTHVLCCAMLQDSCLALAAAITAASALPASSCAAYLMQGYTALGAAGNAAVQQWVSAGGGLLLGGHEWGASGNTTGGCLPCMQPYVWGMVTAAVGTLFMPDGSAFLLAGCHVALLTVTSGVCLKQHRGFPDTSCSTAEAVAHSWHCRPAPTWR